MVDYVADKPIRYISLFSGIEAASVAWESLGWEPVAFADFDDFPSAVLAHRFPDVPNLKDITKVDWNEYKGKAELVVGGSPCQSFSVAGKRLGMDDPRGNLAIEYLRVIDAVRPKWFVYENVAGLLSSDEGRDFGAFLGLVGELGYGFAYRVLDAQHFGVPQRRRRVFVIGCADGDWRSAASVLFERESLRRDSKKSRKTRKIDSTHSQRGFDTEGWTFGGPDTSDERRGIETEHAHPTIFDDYNQEQIDDGITPTLRKNPDSVARVMTDIPEGIDIGFSHTQGLSPQVSTEAFPTLRAQGNGHGVLQNFDEDDKPIFIQNAHKGELAGMTFDTDKPSNTVGTQPDAVAQSFRFDSLASNSMKSSNPHSGVALVEVSPTIDTTDPNPSKNQGGLAIVQESNDDDFPFSIDEDAEVHAMMGSGAYVSSERVNTLVAREGGVGNTQHTLVQKGEYQAEGVVGLDGTPLVETDSKKPMGTIIRSISAAMGNQEQVVIVDENEIIKSYSLHGKDQTDDVNGTIHTRIGGGDRADYAVVNIVDETVTAGGLDMTSEGTDIIGTVCARVGNKGLQDHAVVSTFAIQDADHIRDDGGNPATGMGINIDDDKQYTLLARGVHGVAQIEEQTFVDGFHGTIGDVASTLSGGMLKANLQCVGEETEGVVFTQNQREEVREMEVAGTVTAESGMHQTNFVRQEGDVVLPIQIVAKGQNGSGIGDEDSPSYTLSKMGNEGVAAFTTKGDGSVFEAEVHPTLQTGGGQAGQGFPAVRRSMVVRKLTPIECERLQGFPDNWTQVPWRGKAAEDCPDSHRYKACGNSMAVPVMKFIGEGIDFIHKQNLTPQPTTSDNRVLDSAQDGVVVSKGSMGEWFD